MVIRKGEPWGVGATCPDDLVTATTDAELADLLAARSADALTVSGGDLHRTVGSPRLVAGAPARLVPVDLLRVELDGSPEIAVAHVVARRPGWRGWWLGPLHAVCNAQFAGRWDVAPGGHPNDGRAEVIDVDAAMSWRQRWGARRRLPSGTHLPHPDIRLTHRSEVTWELDGTQMVWVDGRRRGRPRTVRVTVEPDAYELHV